MQTNPIATITMRSGKVIMVELFPKTAPNTVNSFIQLAKLAVFDDYDIARIEPGFVVDASTNHFGKEEAKYLIENEALPQDAENYVRHDLGYICMGGYDGYIAGGEFFFPLAHFKNIDGAYPCFGKVLEGSDEIVRLGQAQVEEFANAKEMSFVMHKPVNPENIKSVTVETHGLAYPDPVKLERIKLPEHW